MEILANLSNTIFDPVFNGCGFSDDSETYGTNLPSEYGMTKRGCSVDLIPRLIRVKDLEKGRKAGFSVNSTIMRSYWNLHSALFRVEEALRTYKSGNDDAYQALTGGSSSITGGIAEFRDLRKAVQNVAEGIPALEMICDDIEQLYKERFSGGIPAYHGATDLDDQVAREYGD